MGKLVVGAAVALLVFTMGLVSIVAAVSGGSSASGSSGTSGGSGSSGAGSGDGGPAVPAGWLSLYRRAATTCPGLPWSVVAGIGTVETGSGRSTAPGVWSGANGAGAEGPMQFLPSIFLRSTPT
jgi:hypothetical protein